MKSRVESLVFKEGVLTFPHDTEAWARISGYAEEIQGNENKLRNGEVPSVFSVKNEIQSFVESE